jgi:acetyl esterase
LVYFHGGGGVVGSIDLYDPLCRDLADESRAAVLSVEYRLAPEHPFPTGIEDAAAAYRWATEHGEGLGIDSGRIAVGGDSMGGNFAAAISQQALSGALPLPCFQLLLYPLLDIGRSCRSHELFADGYFLTRQLIDYFVAHYISDPAHLQDPRNLPLFIDDPTGLPPALIVNAGFDPLRDEGRRYAERLRDANVPVTVLDYEGAIHGFLNTAGVMNIAARAIVDIGRETRQALL